MKNFLTKGLVVILCGALLTSCSMSKAGKGALIGAGSGAAIGAGVGALIGKDGTSTAVGAAVGTAVGATACAIIGKTDGKKAAELEALENVRLRRLPMPTIYRQLRLLLIAVFYSLPTVLLSARNQRQLSPSSPTP